MENGELVVIDQSLTNSPSGQSRLESVLSSFAVDMSLLTQLEYKRAANEFLRLFGEDVTTAGTVGLDHVKRYISVLRERGLSQNTINKKISALSSFCSHLVGCGMLEENPVGRVSKTQRRRGRDTPPPATLKSWQVRAIFDALDPSKPNFYMHRAVLGVGFYTGLRSAELRGLTVSSIGSAEGVKVITTTIKGNHLHRIPIHPVLARYLDEHLEDLTRRGVDISNPRQLLFTCARKGFTNKALSDAGLNYMFKRALERAGIEKDSGKRYSPHCMRRSMGNNMEEKNVPLFRIQKAYGHTSADTTVGYLDREEKLDQSGVWQVSY